MRVRAYEIDHDLARQRAATVAAGDEEDDTPYLRIIDQHSTLISDTAMTSPPQTEDVIVVGDEEYIVIARVFLLGENPEACLIVLNREFSLSEEEPEEIFRS